MKKLYLSIICILVLFVIITLFPLGRIFDKKVSFNDEVRPILNKNCISCHGGVKKSGGFGIIFREDAISNTKSGKPAIIPGDADNSEFMKRILHHDPEVRMPYKKPPLSEDEIAILKKWIDQGAQWEEHWAFIKPVPQTPPDVSADGFIKNDIDRFILQKIKENELSPSPEADKRTLIRRLCLDLTGLPPTLEEVDAFLRDKSPDAYNKLVDRLLAKPAYGERWTAMWLDLARYGDSKGYEKDLQRNIWRYRDYVIKSFNADKPYDQFVKEQLAGDLMVNATEDQIIATAFHRNTMNNDEGGTDNEEFRVAAVVDRVNTTFDVFQGITMSCTQCHSHPYDPIHHKEYYQFMAFLNNTADADFPNETPVFISKADYDFEKAKQAIKAIDQINKNATKFSEVDFSNINIIKKEYVEWQEAEDYDRADKVVKNQTDVSMKEGSYIVFEKVNFSDIGKIGVGYFSEKGCLLEARLDGLNGPLMKTFEIGSTFGEIYHYYKDIKPVKGVHDIFFKVIKDKKGGQDVRLHAVSFQNRKKVNHKTIDMKLDSLQNLLVKSIKPTGTPIFQELPKEEKRITQVFVRGNWMAKEDTVQPGVPSILNPFPGKVPKDRLGMAHWITSKENPLTARVAVNRFWEQIFGYGLVETLEDFGSQGSKPSHPELLDYLAIKFMDDYNWSMKKILKEIVMSGTYRQSSAVNNELLQKDARNKYLARGARVRLTSEQVRDQALAVSGLLSSKMLGPSVMPYQPTGIWQGFFLGDFAWKLSEGEDKYRRAIYTFIRKSSPYPSMLTYDAPSREFCIPRRIRTNTPLQALNSLNDTTYLEAAASLANKMYRAEEKTPVEKIKKGFRIALCRNPDEASLKRLQDLYTKASDYYNSNADRAKLMAGVHTPARDVAPYAIVANAILNLDEFVTKE